MILKDVIIIYCGCSAWIRKMQEFWRERILCRNANKEVDNKNVCGEELRASFNLYLSLPTTSSAAKISLLNVQP